MDDREFGTELRRGLLILLRAVERRYGVGDARPGDGTMRRQSPAPLPADPAGLGRRPLHKEFATTY